MRHGASCRTRVWGALQHWLLARVRDIQAGYAVPRHADSPTASLRARAHQACVRCSAGSRGGHGPRCGRQAHRCKRPTGKQAAALSPGRRPAEHGVQGHGACTDSQQRRQPRHHSPLESPDARPPTHIARGAHPAEVGARGRGSRQAAAQAQAGDQTRERARRLRGQLARGAHDQGLDARLAAPRRAPRARHQRQQERQGFAGPCAARGRPPGRQQGCWRCEHRPGAAASMGGRGRGGSLSAAVL